MDDKNLATTRDPNMDEDSNTERDEQENKPLSELSQNVPSTDDDVGGKMQEEHMTDPEKDSSSTLGDRVKLTQGEKNKWNQKVYKEQKIFEKQIAGEINRLMLDHQSVAGSSKTKEMKTRITWSYQKPESLPALEIEKFDRLPNINPTSFSSMLWKPSQPTLVLEINNYIDRLFYKEENVMWESLSSMRIVDEEPDPSGAVKVALNLVDQSAVCGETQVKLAIDPEVERTLMDILVIVVNDAETEPEEETRPTIYKHTWRLIENYDEIFLLFHPPKFDLFVAACGAGHYQLVSILLTLPRFNNTENYLLNIFSHMMKNRVLPAYALIIKRQWNQTILVIRTNPSYWLDGNRTAMMRAVAFGQTEIVKLLIRKGFSVNEDSVEGFTPLLFATRLAHEEMMQLLIDNGANVDGSLATCAPLFIAVHRNSVLAVKLLIKNLADPVQEFNHVSILDLATFKGHLNVVEFLLNDKSVQFFTYQTKKSFVLALQLKHTRMIGLFIDAGIELGGKELSFKKTTQEDYFYYILEKLIVIEEVDGEMYKFINPLMMSSLLGNVEIIKYLVNRGFDINERNTFGETALSIAVAYGNYEAVNFLILNGADLSNQDSIGLTPFMRAAKFNQIKIMQLLLEHGVDLRQTTKNVQAFDAMSVACLEGHLDAVKFLLGNGVDLYQKLPNNGNYLYDPLVCGHTEIVKELLKSEEEQRFQKQAPKKIAASPKKTLAPLKKVVERSFEQCSKLVNSSLKESGDSPLIIAARLGHTEILNILLSKGAPVDHKNRAGFTALHAAASHGYNQCTDALINAGANVNNLVVYIKGCNLKQEDFFSYLNLSVKNAFLTENLSKTGYTPLNVASTNGFLYVVKKLVENGADVNLKSDEAYVSPPLVRAAHNEHEEIVAYLLNHGADVDLLEPHTGYSALSCACQVGATSIVKLLIKAKANIEHRSLTGLTPLMEAVYNEHVEVAKVLLAAKANAATKSTSRETALILAVENGNDLLCELLVKDSDINAKYKKGNTALWIACNKGYHKIVELLLKHKADPDAADNAGISPLLTAIKNGHVEVVKLLLGKNAVLPTNNECARCSSGSSLSVPKQSIEDCIKLVSEAKAVYAERAKALADSFLEQLDREKASKKESIEKQKAKAKRRAKKRNKTT